MKPLARILFAAGVLAAAAVPAAPALPTPAQADWLDAAIGIFIHWAPNVYQGSEGDDLSTPRGKINPDGFDAGRIADSARSAHAGYVVFVAKHIGGYCAWQTATTDYSLKTSPWRGGKGDMVGDLAKACAERGLRFGVYLSPRSDIHHVGTGGKAADVAGQKEYNEIYRRQLRELLTGYGPMFEMWFDGGNVVPVNDVIEELAPGIITFQGRRRNSTRWVGTEEGFAPYPCWNTVAWKEGETMPEGAGTPEGNLWAPAECDVSILRPAWFWREGSDSRVLTLDALLEIYYLSVGRGVNLLLNITPDGHGVVPAAQTRRLKELGDQLDARFGHPLAVTHGSGDSVELSLGGAVLVDHVLVREDIRQGERVRRFVLEGRGVDGGWRSLWHGTQIGARQLVPIPPATLAAVRVRIEKSEGPAVLAELAAFNTGRAVPARAWRTPP